mmetsp:Transcript_45594/g.67213  ORF Transcript_45594/g.67213 Transcript_45594/m.67213 type:complete len:81 (+) Transcript_45594:255-497(+)
MSQAAGQNEYVKQEFDTISIDSKGSASSKRSSKEYVIAVDHMMFVDTQERQKAGQNAYTQEDFDGRLTHSSVFTKDSLCC